MVSHNTVLPNCGQMKLLERELAAIGICRGLPTCLADTHSKDLVTQLLQHTAAVVERAREACWTSPAPRQPAGVQQP